MNFTSITAVGYVANDVHYRPAEGTKKSMAKFSVCVNKGKETTHHATFIPAVAWGDLADRISAAMTKGREVLVSGELTGYNRTLPDGTTIQQLNIRVHHYQLGQLPRGQRDDNERKTVERLEQAARELPGDGDDDDNDIDVEDLDADWEPEEEPAEASA